MCVIYLKVTKRDTLGAKLVLYKPSSSSQEMKRSHPWNLSIYHVVWCFYFLFFSIITYLFLSEIVAIFILSETCYVNVVVEDLGRSFHWSFWHYTGVTLFHGRIQLDLFRRRKVVFVFHGSCPNGSHFVLSKARLCRWQHPVFMQFLDWDFQVTSSLRNHQNGLFFFSNCSLS